MFLSALAFLAFMFVFFGSVIVIPVPVYWVTVVVKWFLTKGWFFLLKGIIVALSKRFVISAIWIFFLPTRHRRVARNVRRRFIDVKLAGCKRYWHELGLALKTSVIVALSVMVVVVVLPIAIAYYEVTAAVTLGAVPIIGLPGWIKNWLANFINQTILRLISEKNLEYLTERWAPQRVREVKEHIEDRVVRLLVEQRFRRNTHALADRVIKFIVDRLLVLQRIIRKTEKN